MCVSVHWDSIYIIYSVYSQQIFLVWSSWHGLSPPDSPLHMKRYSFQSVYHDLKNSHCLKAVNPTEHMKEVLSKNVTAAFN